MEERAYGINKDHAHMRAVELVPEEFFWNCFDELAPFGSDEGATALEEFRAWRKKYRNSQNYDCLKWAIEGVGEINISDYNEQILERHRIESQMLNDEFDDYQYIFTLDVSVIAVGFGQLVDEGKIDDNCKQLILLAINRQKIWAEFNGDWEYKDEYIKRMNVLERVLKIA